MTSRIVRIEKLASTGEGIARTADGVGFVDRALPGELVETNVYQVKKKFWRGTLRAVREPSPDRLVGPHAGCAGCDWAHFEPSAARKAKRDLFLETMQRLGRIEPARFGDLPIEASPPGYRLRTRLHVAGGALGYFAPGTHRVVPAGGCEAIAGQTRALLPAVETAIRECGAQVSEIAILEDIEGSRRLLRATLPGAPGPAAELSERLAAWFAGVRILGAGGNALVRKGEPRLRLQVGGRTFHVSVDTFFQGNRYLVGTIYAAVLAEARRVAPGIALDAFGGVGLFAGALLDAGHRVISVEAEPGIAADATRTLEEWPDRGRCESIGAAVGDYLEKHDRRFAGVVADPPRTGLGTELARELARRTGSGFVYVSCDPATLARDLSAILAEGFEVRTARLFDFFALTHRVEAVVSLERVA